MVFDTQGITNVTASRRELALQKQILEETKPAVEKYGDSLDVLGRLLRKQLIDVEQHNELNRQLKAELPENVSAENAMTAALQEGASARRSIMTATEQLAEAEKRYAAAKRGVVQLQNDGIITDEKAGEALANLRANSPAAIEAENKRAIAAREVSGIVERNTTAEERLNAQRATANRLRGQLGETNYAREIQRINSLLPENIALEQRKNAEIARGKALNEQYMPVWQRTGQQITELRAQHLAGRVGIDSYRNGMIQLTATQLTGIPVVGRYASMLASIGPAGVAATAGLAIAGLAVRNVHDQMQKIDELLNTAENVGIAADQFQRMSAAAHLADIDARAFSSGIETMMVSISKAAMDPEGKIGKVFKLAELDSKALKAMRPEEAFQKVTVALQGMANADDRLRAAKGIFVNPDFLRISASDFELANKNIQAMGGAIDDVKAEKFKEMDKSIDSMNQNIDLFWKNLTFEVSPGLETAAKSATKLLQALDVKSFNPFSFENLLLPGNPLFVAIDAAKKAMVGPPPVKPMANVTKDRTAADEDAESAITKQMKTLTDSIEDQSQKLRLSAHAYEEWKLAQAGIPEKLREEALAHFDAGETAKLANAAILADQKRQESVRDTIAALEDETAKLRMSERAYRDLQVARRVGAAGGEPADIETAVNTDRATEQLEKQLAVAKKRADSVSGIMDGLREETSALHASAAAYALHRNALISGLSDETTMAGLAARAHRDRQLALAGGTMLERVAAAALDAKNAKMAKEIDSEKLAIDTIKTLEKETRQFAMTARERTMDDLSTAGIKNTEELKHIDLLLKEKEVRESILQLQHSSAFAIKANSREAAEMLARAEFVGSVMSRPSRVGEPAATSTTPAVVSRSTVIAPPPPVVAPTTDTWSAGEKWKPTDFRERFDSELQESRAAKAVQAFERRLEIAADLTARRAMDVENATSIRADIARSPSRSDRSESAASKPPVVNTAKMESLLQSALSALMQIGRNTVQQPMKIEEVTL